MSESNIKNNLDFEISKIKNHLIALKQIDFELAYLALLTYQGLKPLSRWEKSQSEKEIELLTSINLHTKEIHRTVKTNRKVNEIIFSRSPAYINLYEQRFENRAIDKSPETQRWEGFLFGYPPCCVEQYIREPYTINNLKEDDRNILFHWMCKNCKVTPLLLSAYRNSFNMLKE